MKGTVILKTFDNAIEAHLSKNKLESEGIDSFLKDENIVAMNPLYNFTVGGIKLFVFTEDFEKAKEILEITDQSHLQEEGKDILCPNCKSQNLYYNYKSIKSLEGVLSFLVSLLFMVLPFNYKTVYKCKDCDEEFTK